VAPICNLYRLDRSPAEIAKLFNAADHWQHDLARHYVAPGHEGATVIDRDGARITGLMTWGMPNAGHLVTNVRNLESPFWSGMLDAPHHRCLVPVTGFEEWSARPDPATGKKTAHWFSIPSRPVFAFAGIWRKVDGQPHFAFLTTAPNELVGVIHPRAMPVILEESEYDRWLTASRDEVVPLVAAYPSQLMTCS
jgi:putative SOS response-associated peptidase YedK